MKKSTPNHYLNVINQVRFQPDLYISTFMTAKQNLSEQDFKFLVHALSK